MDGGKSLMGFGGECGVNGYIARYNLYVTKARQRCQTDKYLANFWVEKEFTN